MRSKLIILCALAVLAGLRTPAVAKVVFTGYGNIQMTAHSQYKIFGDPAALSALGLPGIRDAHTRGFNIESLGLFATTNLREDMDFLVDFTYRQIGNTTGETRLQYAYLEYRPREDVTGRVGKILLPFGFYNHKRFYPFQRIELTAPLFQRTILGLPIAHLGADVQKRFQTTWSRIEVDFYGVNGYGATPSNPNQFRSPTLPGGLILSNNVGATNNNGDVAFGGRINFAELAGKDMETGASYYRGAWDGSGKHFLQLINTHFHGNLSRLDVVAEYLHMDVEEDSGFAAAVGEKHWMTDGGFLVMSYPLWKIREMPLSPFVAAEYTVSHGKERRGDQEKMAGYRAGLTLQAMESVRIKLEASYLNYILPIYGAGKLKLELYSAVLGLVVSF